VTLAFAALLSNPDYLWEWCVDRHYFDRTRLLTLNKILILIFAEVLGLYGASSRYARGTTLIQVFVLSGLIVALIMNTQAANASVGPLFY